MRDYGKVHTSFWTSASIRELSEDGRALAIYLLTCPHGTISGVFRLPDGYVCEDLQWAPERVAKGFTELFDNGFANRCETTKWVWILKFLDWNPPENPNQRKAASKVVCQVPVQCGWIAAYMRVCGPLLGFEVEPKTNPSATLSQPFLNQEQEQEQYQEQYQEQEKEKTPQARKRAASSASAGTLQCPADVPEPVWQDFLALRKAKRAPLSETAMAGIRREAEKAGIGLADALACCCEAGWMAFKADWYADRLARGGAGRSAGARGNAAASGETAYQRSMRERVAEVAPSIARAGPPGGQDAGEFFRTVEGHARVVPDVPQSATSVGVQQ